MGPADLHVRADSRTWLGFLAKERSLVWVLVRRTIRLKGSPRLLRAFGQCFPSWMHGRSAGRAEKEQGLPLDRRHRMTFVALRMLTGDLARSAVG